LSENTGKPQTEELSGALKEIPKWLRLDTAATIYPGARKRNWNATYRMAIVLKEEIDPFLLQQAVDDIAPRIPSYFVQLRSGLFWYYFEHTENTSIVEQEDYYPCRPSKLFELGKPLLRVLYYKRRIALEVFHSVGDGGATFLVLKTLAARYLELKGYTIEKTDEILNINEPPRQEELEDAFKKHYVKMKGLKRKEENAYQYKKKIIPNYLNVIHGMIPVSDLKACAKDLNITITDYLVAAFLYAHYLNAPKPCKKPIIISVPVSMRPYFGSSTLRNFSLYTNFGIYPDKKENFTFEDIISEIAGKLKEGTTKEVLQKGISINVKDATNPFVRLVPSILKRYAFRFIFYYMGEAKFTSPLTNLGIIKVPETMKKHMDRFEVILGASPSVHLTCTAFSDGEMMSITFSSDYIETDVQRDFFRFLSGRGARVRVECNREESWSKA